MPKISIVTDKNKVLKVKRASYCDIGDAAGDINGGDFWSFVREQYPNVTIKEIRIILEDHLVFKDDDE